MDIRKIDEDELNTGLPEVPTYRMLRDFLNHLPDDSEYLEQPVQFAKSHPVEDHVYELIPAVVLATVDELQLKYARSSVDNRRHGNELVFFCDYNPYSVEGATSYDWDAEDDNILSEKNPNFPSGHDASADWSGPAQKLVDQWWEDEVDDVSVTQRAVLKSRLADNRKHYPDKANHGE